MNLEQLSGRELDAQVAQHIFQLLVELRTNSKTGKPEYLHAVGSDPQAPGWVRVPAYSVSAGPNINVCVWLRNQGWTQITPDARAPLGEVEVVYRHRDGRTISARGSLNEAVCRAALKAREQS